MERRQELAEPTLKDNQPESEYQIVPENAPYEPGFNLKTVWAALFVGFIMLPGAIYLGLVTGTSMSGASEWVTVILFIEITKRAFIRLKTQEIIILYWVAGGLVSAVGRLGTGAASFGGLFGGPIWDQYFVQSPQAASIAKHIPSWVVPPPGSDALLQRTFFHHAWIKPIIVGVLTLILARVNSLALGYVLFRVTSDVERLPFPLAMVSAWGATALAETSGKTEGWRWRVFSIGAFIGLLWGAVYVVIPTLSGVFLTSTVQILPIPFIDLTISIKSILPSTALVLGTDLLHLLIGFIIPFWIVVGSFIGAVLSNFVANPILYKHGILHTWEPGMSAIPTMAANSLDFWLSFTIGTAFIIAVVGIGITIKTLLRSSDGRGLSFRTVEPPEGRGDVKIVTCLIFWAASTSLFVVMVHYLVPEFPWWITAAFGFLWTPVSSYIGARMIGLTGSPYGSSIPYLREASFYLSGYKGVAVWFAPIPMFDHGGMASTFKQLELTKTTFGSLVKLAVLSITVMLVCSFIFWSVIWKLGPIPSSSYPFVLKMWPFDAIFQSMWLKSTLPGGKSLIRDIINWRYIASGLGFGGIFYFLLSIFKAPTLIFYGFVAGVGGGMSYGVLPQFLGAMLGRFYFLKKYGEERWTAYAAILIAGYSCGMGLIGMTSIAVALISKAVSQIIF